MSVSISSILTWTDVDLMIADIVYKINESKFRPTMIGAIPRGGWVPATLIAQKLNIRKTVSIDVDKSSLETKLFITDPCRLANEHILLVEDSTETGNTIQKAAKTIAIKSDNATIKTAALLIKNNCSVKPDFYLDQVSKIPDFPWDV